MAAWGIPEAILERAARDLDLQVPIEHAYITSAGVLVIVTRYGATEVPAPPSYGRTDTLPSGSTQPGSSPAGGSVPPQTSSPPLDAGPEPPQNQSTPAVSGYARNCQADGPCPSADDFTAIPGVGPVTAKKLHHAGLYTYDDLRDWYNQLETLGLGPNQAHQVRAWLAEHSSAEQRPA